MRRLGSPLTELRDAYDVVIVGSGYGGSVCAARFAEAGLRTAVLERGREYLPGDFPSTLPEFLRASRWEGPGRTWGAERSLFRFVVDHEYGALQGVGLGGGSLINAGVALRPPTALWQEERWPRALREDAEHGLREAFERAEAMLRPTPLPARYGVPGGPVLKLEALQMAARELGPHAQFQRVPVNVAFESGQSAAGVPQPACSLCGDCLSGCNSGAKGTLNANYLAHAAKWGAELFTEVRVDWIERTAGEWLVRFTPTAWRRELYQAPPLVVRAGRIVLAAGALATTEILLRSREHGLALSSELGARFSGNATTLAFSNGTRDRIDAVGNPASGSPVGPAIAGMLRVPQEADPTHDLTIQESAVPSALGALVTELLSLPQLRQNGIKAWLKSRGSAERARHFQCYAVTSRDESRGRLRLERGRLRIDWPRAGSQPIIAEIHRRIEDASRALGGQFAANPWWQASKRRPVLTTHPLGGCALADSAERGVVNHRGEVFAGPTGDRVHAGLLVCDGSVFPGALGLNPLLTISALAERAARLALQAWRAEAGPTVPPIRAAESSQARVAGPASRAPNLRFTERMRGYLSPSLAELPAKTRPPDAVPFELITTLCWNEAAWAWKDPTRVIGSLGSVRCALLSRQPLLAHSGRFQLFVPDERGGLRIVHRFWLRAEDGKRYFVDAYKLVDRSAQRGAWSDTATLYFVVHLDGADGPILGRGAVETRLSDFVRLLMTMTSDLDDLDRRLTTKGRFGRAFLARVFDEYGGVRRTLWSAARGQWRLP